MDRARPDHRAALPAVSPHHARFRRARPDAHARSHPHHHSRRTGAELSRATRLRQRNGLMAAAQVIDGKAFAADLRARIADAVPSFRAATSRAPGLAVVLVGDDPASAGYVGSKGKATVAAGMESFEHRLPATATQDQVEALLAQLNADDAVAGILLQLPLQIGRAHVGTPVTGQSRI